MFRTWHGGMRIVIRSEMKWILNLTASRECLANEEQSSNEIVSINRSLNSVWRSSSAKNRNRFAQVPTSMNLYNFRIKSWLVRPKRGTCLMRGKTGDVFLENERFLHELTRLCTDGNWNSFFRENFLCFDKIDDLTWGYLNSFRWELMILRISY